MTFNLGIDLGDERISAAYEQRGTMRMVSFGATRSEPLLAHVGRDGTIRTGAEAAAAAGADPAGMVADLAARLSDPRSAVINGYAITGEMLLAHVLTAVVDRAEAQVAGDSLGQLVLAHPPAWPAERRAGLRSAAARAGLHDVDVVSAARALERAPENARHLPEQAAALGAAVLAVVRSRGAGGAAAPAAPRTGPPRTGPLGTGMAGAGAAGAGVAGDATTVAPVVGAAPRPRPGRPAPPLATSSPTSVFDATDPSGDRPPLAVGSAGGPPTGGGGLPPTGGDDPGRSGRTPFFLAGGVLAVLLLVLLVLVVTRGGDDDPTDATGPSGSTTSTSTSTSTTTSSTTSTTSTTTSVVASTTTSSSTTTTSRPAATTTSTVVPPSRIGPVALAKNGLILQYGASNSFTLRFGDDADGTLARLVALIGKSTSDSGWKQVELCTGAETRRVVFDDLELVFTKNAAGAPNGSRTFQQWFVDSPGKKPDGLVTIDRLGIGSTIADLRAVYGQGLKVVQPIAGDPSGLFTTAEGGDPIDGITTGISDKAWVRQMWAGTACQRVAD